MDLEQDGTPEIIAPSMGRRSVKLVRFEDGVPVLADEIDLETSVVHGMICDPCESPVRLHFVDGQGDLKTIEPGW